MLDPREIRENSSFIEEGLSRRGLKVDLNSLKSNSKRLKELEQKRSKLQEEANAIGKEVGKKIKAGNANNARNSNTQAIHCPRINIWDCLE